MAAHRRAPVAVLLGLLVAVGLLAGPTPAWAHTVLISSEPAAGAALAESPGVARLHFSQDLDPSRSSVRLVDGSGVPVTGAAVLGAAGDARVLAVELPRLGHGSYALVWQAVAARDEHLSSGAVVFSIGPSRTTAVVAGPTGVADTVRRWAGLVALAMVVGPLAVALLVLDVGMAAARRRLLLTATMAAVAADLTTFGTRQARLWSAEVAVSVVLTGVLVMLRRRGGRLLAAGAVAAVLTLCWLQALQSHAAAVGAGRGAALVAGTVHILAGLLWLGAVPALLVAVLPSGARAELLRAIRGRFAVLAGTSVGLVVVTGLYSAGVEIASVDDLAGTSYGRTVLVKTTLLVAMGALGLAGAIRLHDTRPALSRLIGAEVAVGLALLLAAGTLAGLSPPNGPAPDATEPGHTATGTADDLRVTVQATPNRPGLNWITVLAESTRRPAPAPIQSVDLRIDGGRVIPLRPLVAGRYLTTYQADGAGPLRVVVIVHRGGQPHPVAVGWRVDATGPTATVAPGRRLASYTNAIALVLLEGAVATVAWYLLRGRRRRTAALVPAVDDLEAEPELIGGERR